jgi:acyl transferase domain-containing protein
MGSKLLDLKSIKITDVAKNGEVKLESISKKDIAIIGMAGKFAEADNIYEYWDKLSAGQDLVRDFPESRRKDSNEVLLDRGVKPEDIEYHQGGYFNEVDKFDYSFFRLSPKEASLMDPNQRLFLETAWEAIEGAGYGGKRIMGTRTGVYVGHNSDFDERYETFIRSQEPSSLEFAVPGNIKPIIASRISYILDLKGPSFLVDTACSSSLMAVHLACQGIRNGECEMAIAGGVKVNLIPVKSPGEEGIGIRSSNARTKTFDDSSDGTGSSEVVAAVLLKPLKNALEDGDTIYAVIKGSASNQDGSSVGITAPNAAAQEDVITRAWKDAGINPETIRYIETHGTGTKLGDPIEIEGILSAFSKFTLRKQFCAVGSAKSNLGHPDHSAGIAGLVKAVLALRNRAIPPTLHFTRPNRKINFESTPVYVNDKLSQWETGNGQPCRCAVSSFGLSGTNCHIVLEEAPEVKAKGIQNSTGLPQILTISARNEKVMHEYIKNFKAFVDKGCNQSLEDICYTANTGRGHYNIRVAFIVTDMKDLKSKLEKISDAVLGTVNIDGVYYGEHRVVAGDDQKRTGKDVTERERKKAGEDAFNLIQRFLTTSEEKILNDIGIVYVKGADIEWDELYSKEKRARVWVPTYPLERKRCWVEREPGLGRKLLTGRKTVIHPLVDVCIAESFGMDIYATEFSVDKHWVLSEHKVIGDYVVPGTTYVELARAIGSKYYSGGFIEIRDVMFLSRLALKDGESREVQVIINHHDGHKEFAVVSKPDGSEQWLRHSEGKIYPLKDRNSVQSYDLEDIKSRCKREKPVEYKEDPEAGVQVGPRFKGLKKVYIGENELLATLDLSGYQDDFKEYYIHPSLMDSSVNIAVQGESEGFYLPMSYKDLKVYAPMPAKVYSYLKRKGKEKQSAETITFDVLLMDETGNVFIEIEDYTIKKVHLNDAKTTRNTEEVLDYYEVNWVEQDIMPAAVKNIQGTVLLLKGEGEICDEAARELSQKATKLIEVSIGSEFKKVNTNQYIVSGSQEDYVALSEELKDTKPEKVIHMLTLSDKVVSGVDDLQEKQQYGVYSLFNLVRVFINNKVSDSTEFIVVSDYVHEVTGKENVLKPYNATIFGLGKVIGQEYPGMKCRCVDIDENMTVRDILREITSEEAKNVVAYRNGKRYIEEFNMIESGRYASEPLQLVKDGVYIITGGTGGIGLEIGKYLAKKNTINLYLINRSKMPERDTWENILRSNEDTKTCDRIRAIRDMEASGAKVTLISADVSSYDDVKTVIDSIKSKHGKINGVIHCAGVAGDGFIVRKQEKTFRSVLAPKVQGTFILDELTRNEDMNFFIMYSSVSSLYGTAGQGDYTAANSYLDSYASYMNKAGKRTLCINWPAWKETGMAVDYGVTDERTMFKSISNAKAIAVIDELINTSITRVIPGEINFGLIASVKDQFPLRLSEQLIAIVDSKVAQQAVINDTRDKSGSAGVVLTGKSEKEYGEIEEKLAHIWTQILKLQEIDVYDNFYDVGGDSILATRLLKEMEKVYEGLVDISDIFTYSTIYDMARYIGGKIIKGNITEEIACSNDEDTDDEDIDDILARLSKGEITAEEADKLFDLGDDE